MRARVNPVLSRVAVGSRTPGRRPELALVPEANDVVGLITATDALEAVRGEFEDPLDVESDRPNEATE